MTAAVDDSGSSLLWNREVSAYGSMIRSLGTGDDEMSFHGTPYEASGGLFAMGVRHMDAKRGIFLQPEPLLVGGGPSGAARAEPSSMSPYRYARSSPTSFSDRSGLEPSGSSDTGMSESEQSTQPEIVYEGRCPSCAIALHGIADEMEKLAEDHTAFVIATAPMHAQTSWIVYTQLRVTADFLGPKTAGGLAMDAAMILPFGSVATKALTAEGRIAAIEANALQQGTAQAAQRLLGKPGRQKDIHWMLT